MGYSPWGRKELDTAEHIVIHLLSSFQNSGSVASSFLLPVLLSLVPFKKISLLSLWCDLRREPMETWVFNLPSSIIPASISFYYCYLFVYCLSSSPLDCGFQDNLFCSPAHPQHPEPFLTQVGVQQMTESICWRRKLATHSQHGGRKLATHSQHGGSRPTRSLDFLSCVLLVTRWVIILLTKNM